MNETPITLRSLSARRQAAWNALQSLETALITCDSPALRQAIEDKHREIKLLTRSIAKGQAALRARREARG